MPHETSGVESQVWRMCISDRSTSSRIRSECVLPPRLAGFRADINYVRLQAKHIRLEDKTKEPEERRYELEQLREVKDEEIQILQESVDSTLQQMDEMQSVYLGACYWLAYRPDANTGLRVLLSRRPMLSCPPSFLITARNSTRSSVSIARSRLERC